MTDADENSYRSKLENLGDCLLVVKGDGVIKTHIHTNNPGKVLEIALELGALKDIKIDNMRLQHQNLHSTEEEINQASSKPSEPEKILDLWLLAVGKASAKFLRC